MKINVNIIEISEIRLQNEKEPTINISLPNYVYEHNPIESGKGETVLYIDKNTTGPKHLRKKDNRVYFYQDFE